MSPKFFSPAKQLVELVSAIVGLFVFLTGVQSLPSLLAKKGSVELSVFKLQVSLGIKLSLFIISIALLYLLVFLISRSISRTWFAPDREVEGDQGTLIFLTAFLLEAGALTLIIESFFGPLEDLFVSFMPSFLTIGGIVLATFIGMLPVIVGFKLPVGSTHITTINRE